MAGEFPITACKGKLTSQVPRDSKSEHGEEFLGEKYESFGFGQENLP
jgi:hypothetical protein